MKKKREANEFGAPALEVSPPLAVHSPGPCQGCQGCQGCQPQPAGPRKDENAIAIKMGKPLYIIGDCCVSNLF